jgi:hypothetical protein
MGTAVGAAVGAAADAAAVGAVADAGWVLAVEAGFAEVATAMMATMPMPAAHHHFLAIRLRGRSGGGPVGLPGVTPLQPSPVSGLLGGVGGGGGLAGTCVGVWMAMVRSPPETQFVDADPQHLGEPLRITGVGAFFAFLPSNGGARRNSAPEGQRLLGQEEPLSKLANSIPRHLYGIVPNMYSAIRRFMQQGR